MQSYCPSDPQQQNSVKLNQNAEQCSEEMYSNLFNHSVCHFVGAHWVNTTYSNLNFCQVIYDIIWYWLHTLLWLHLLRSNKASRPAGSHLLDPQHGMVITGAASSNNNTMHDDVIKWNHFPRYWPFMQGMHRSRWIPRRWLETPSLIMTSL